MRVFPRIHGAAWRRLRNALRLLCATLLLVSCGGDDYQPAVAAAPPPLTWDSGGTWDSVSWQ